MPAQEWDPAAPLGTAQRLEGALCTLVWHAAQPAGRYFQRLCDCSASLKKCVFISPPTLTPKAERSPLTQRCIPSVCIQQPPGKLFTKELLFAHRVSPQAMLDSASILVHRESTLLLNDFLSEWAFPPKLPE